MAGARPGGVKFAKTMDDVRTHAGNILAGRKAVNLATSSAFHSRRRCRSARPRRLRECNRVDTRPQFRQRDPAPQDREHESARTLRSRLSELPEVRGPDCWPAAVVIHRPLALIAGRAAYLSPTGSPR